MSPAERGDLVLGGQAVIEGVMMKGRDVYAVAVRKPSGEIRVKAFPIVEGTARRRLAGTPVVRGVLTMAAMLVIGYRALRYSAGEAVPDAAGEPGGGAAGETGIAAAGALVLAVALAVGLFLWLPLAVTRLVADALPALSGRMAFNLVDGVARVVVFVAYVAAIGAMEDVRRMFQYHGAEHKVIHAFERKAELVPEAVLSFSRLHPRCGTSFLLFVMGIGVAVFSFIPHDSSLLTKALMRLLLLPAVAGLSYEVLKLSARRAGSGLFRALVAPGLLLQRLTTREPDLSQVEVALASFRRVAPPGAPGVSRVG